MHLYRQPIIVFGLVVPVLIAAALCGIGYMLQSQMADSFANKEKTFKTAEQTRIAAYGVETQVALQRDHLNRWNEQLGLETASTVSTHLRKISEQLPSKEIQQTSFERQSGSSGFGTATGQKSSQLRIAFRGTFRTLQRAFLELETRMPQLQLEELSLNPVAPPSPLLNLQVTYTAWEN
ncbi:MAG: hypothetical protein RLZZ282_1842 [Verrucomicrobiota bacterium]